MRQNTHATKTCGVFQLASKSALNIERPKNLKIATCGAKNCIKIYLGLEPVNGA